LSAARYLEVVVPDGACMSQSILDELRLQVQISSDFLLWEHYGLELKHLECKSNQHVCFYDFAMDVEVTTCTCSPKCET
jgi:hypothetical protein